MKTSTGLITYEASLAMPENKLEEIVRGESRVMPPPTRRHAFLIRRLGRVLEAQLDEKQFRVLIAPHGLGISKEPVMHCRIPDLSVFSTSKLAQETDPHYIWVVPELLVECLSPSNRKGDVAELLADYAGIGVPEVWLLFPELPRLRAYRLQNGELQEAEQAERGVVIPLRLHVRVDVSDLWTAFATGL